MPNRRSDGATHECDVQFVPRRYPTTPSESIAGLSAGEVLDWDVSTWSKAVSFWQRTNGRYLRGARILEIGARDGGLTQWLVAAGAAQVVCTDLRGPTEVAKQRHANHLATGVVVHTDLDATDIGFTNEFDVVIFKSVLGGVGAVGGYESQRRAVDSMRSALQPGGVLLFAENISASPLHRALRQHFVRWGSNWLYPSRGDLLNMLSGFERVEYSTAGFIGLLGRTERQRSLLARADSLLLDWAVNPTWNYVMFGAAYASDPSRGVRTADYR